MYLYSCCDLLSILSCSLSFRVVLHLHIIMMAMTASRINKNWTYLYGKPSTKTKAALCGAICKHLYPDSSHLNEVPVFKKQNPSVSHGERQTPPKDGSFHLWLSLSFYFSPWSSLLLSLLLQGLYFWA